MISKYNLPHHGQLETWAKMFLMICAPKTSPSQSKAPGTCTYLWGQHCGPGRLLAGLSAADKCPLQERLPGEGTGLC